MFRFYYRNIVLSIKKNFISHFILLYMFKT
nr:MAG TPA: hypothetical protein [Caudoviricetes sp.]